MSVTFNSTTPAAPAGNTNVTFQKDLSGNLSGYVPAGGSNIQSAKRRGLFIATATGTNPDAQGDRFSTNPTFNGWTAPTATTGAMGTWTAPAPASVGGFVGSENYWAGRNCQFLFSANVSSTTTVRLWLAMANVTSTATFGNADSNSGIQFMGFRFSNVSGGAGDTHWQAITGDGAATTVTSTGIVPDTNMHRFAVVADDTVPNVKFYIDDVLVATHTTNLPSAIALAGLFTGQNDPGTAHIGMGQAIFECDF